MITTDAELAAVSARAGKLHAVLVGMSVAYDAHKQLERVKAACLDALDSKRAPRKPSRDAQLGLELADVVRAALAIELPAVVDYRMMHATADLRGQP